MDRVASVEEPAMDEALMETRKEKLKDMRRKEENDRLRRGREGFMALIP